MEYAPKLRVYDTIPTPVETLPSLVATCTALKQVVEKLTGTRGPSQPPRLYLQDTQPLDAVRGDLWITEMPASTISYWNGSSWILLATAP